MNDHVIIYDGVCNLCNTSVHFILKRDKARKFYFSPLQSDFASRHTHLYDNSIADPDTVMYIRKKKIYYRSKAVLYILKDLGGIYKLFLFFMIFPEPVRDFFYKIVARNRYKWFGKKDICPAVPGRWKDRFLD